MATYFLDAFVWKILGVIVALGIVSAGILVPLSIPGSAKDKVLDAFVITLSMALLGGVIGYLTGQSREPAIGAILPAVLSLIGGLVLFIVTGRHDNAHRRTASVGALALVLNILVGTIWGAMARENTELAAVAAHNTETLRQATCLRRLEFEIRVREQRISGGLPDANPMVLVPGCTPPFGKEEGVASKATSAAETHPTP
jgi:hypothetical protein